MTVSIRVDAVFPGGFDTVKKEAAATDRELKAQIRERQRLLRLSAGLERDITKEEKAQLRELKEQISQRRRLNTLSKQLDRELAQGQKRQRGAAGSGGLPMAGIGGAAAIAAVAIGTTVKTTIELAREADQARATEQAFVNLSGSVEKARANQEAMERATRDLISEQEQQEIANQLLGMQLVDNAGQLETLVGGARRLGKEFRGLGTADAAEEFALLLSNMSYARLDQFGLSAGKVRERVNALKNSGMEAEAAFRTAVFEEMERTLARLGPEVATTTEKLDAMAGKYSELRVNAGEFASTFIEWTGLLDGAISGLDGWNLGLEKANVLLKTLSDVDFTPDVNTEKLENLAEGINDIFSSPVRASAEAFESLGEGEGVIKSLRDAWQVYGDAVAKATNATIDLATADEDLKKAAEEAAKGPDVTGGGGDKGGAGGDDSAAEEEKRRLERVRDIRRDAAREVLDIDAKANKDEAEARQKYFDDSLAAEQKYKVDLIKGRQDLKKEINKINADTTREAQRERDNADKEIKDSERQREKEQKFQRRREQIDEMADQRLFQYEIKQLGAEGDALAIQQARERRDIEQQAAGERKSLDAEQEQSRFDDSQQRLKDSASARIAEIKRAGAEEKQARIDDLRETETAEKESLTKRIDELKTYREDKLDNIDESRIEALDKLADELTQSKDLTRKELEELKPVVAKIGKETGYEYGENFTEALKEAIKKDDLVRHFTGDFTGRSFGKTSAVGTPNSLAGFATGGDFTVGGSGGTDSQLVAFRATPGERVTVTPPGQGQGRGNITITQQFNNPMFGQNVSQREVMRWIEDANQKLLASLSEMLE